MADALDFHPENIPVGEFPFPPGTTVRANGGGFYTVADRNGSAYLACCTTHERAGTASGWYPQRDRGRTLGEFTDDGGWPELEDCGRDAKVRPLTPDDVGTALGCGCVVELGNLPCEYHASKYGVARPDCGDCEFGIPLVYHECEEGQ